MIGRSLLLPALLLTVLPASGREGRTRDPSSLKGKYPGALVRLQEESYALLVEKATQSLIVYRGNSAGLPELLKVLPANTGEKQGDKEREGDLRTPEGIYFFTSRIEGDQLPEEYGVRAFVTDFPNVFDQLLGKDGSNIWLHATNEPARVQNGYNTKGCVVVTDEDLEGLTPLIRTGRVPGATVMVVEDELEVMEAEAAARQREELLGVISGWKAAWESRNTDRYLTWYSRDFIGQGRDWAGWRAYKDRLNRQYQWIRVEIEGLHLYHHGGTMIAVFNQTYESDRFKARSAKRLYLQEEEGGWKIIRETSLPLPG
jgi:murein L,D-transpeptidase YafK